MLVRQELGVCIGDAGQAFREGLVQLSCSPVRVAVVFDTAYSGWDHTDHERQMDSIELVFDKRNTRPEERIATQFAKWDEEYRERKGIRNVMSRPITKSVRAQIEKICRTAYRAANANPFISYGHDMANAAAKAGMEYSALIQRIVDPAVARYARA